MVAKGGPGSQEEQGFNEKELADIMNEIESLESEFEGENDNAEQSEAPVDASPRACEEPVEKEETVLVSKPIKQKSAPEVRPKVTVSPAQVSPISKTSPDCVPSQMEFHMEGDLQMNMKFYFGETWVKFSADPKEGLLIEMPGGMRFSLPVNVSCQKSKKAS